MPSSMLSKANFPCPPIATPEGGRTQGPGSPSLAVFEPELAWLNNIPIASSSHYPYPPVASFDPRSNNSLLSHAACASAADAPLQRECSVNQRLEYVAGSIFTMRVAVEERRSFASQLVARQPVDAAELNPKGRSTLDEQRRWMLSRGTGSKVWSDGEEEVFWSIVARIRERMSRERPPLISFYEHWFQNLEQGKFSPNAARHVDKHERRVKSAFPSTPPSQTARTGATKSPFGWRLPRPRSSSGIKTSR
ncbi:hypothetical protein F5883DRAFT_635012 [Diaporthe sp. PMI_573]|nr:hypothetical protein F5883DRAFT_635012 [Diaporthaceae sp. PMI_573]